MASNGLMRNIILVILVFFIFLPINAVAPYGHIVADERDKEKVLTVGEKWEIGEGFILTVDTMEKSAKITLSKDDKILAAEEISIDNNMNYEGNVDGIDYVFQTTLRAVERNSAVLADTELYAPDVVTVTAVAAETQAPKVDTQQQNYLTIIVSILVILTLISVIYIKTRPPLEKYISKMEEWEKEGYDVSELKKALEHKK
jgi:hypothetical protein